jgi:hypothetical protein
MAFWGWQAKKRSFDFTMAELWFLDILNNYKKEHFLHGSHVCPSVPNITAGIIG